ncbi:phosphate:Na+ symporter [Treponema rectale]|uniref:Phosphate:Na+ symporter n=1 Tax=Treponema rectale TaxID=744512 RepID=A0A840SG54_9SPIR|nr:Na/Pi symporter [Treponema rectale]MBB5219720.1 phosphate:Na+ symporter [Treponema rectale]
MITVISQILGFIGSLCLLLFGMEMLSNGIQKGAGNNLQSLLHKISGNRFTAVLTGLAVTAIIQSSGATTVMVVSFVNAEIISLTQAIGIIFGANIGTTVTAWIVSFFGFSFSIEAAAIPLFGFGFILKYFKKFKIHNFADCFMGFALLFMALGLLKNSMNLKPDSVSFLQKFQDLNFAGLLLGVLIGTVFTALIHSSSATTAIVLTMSANGSLPWELGAAMVLGSNIGSTVDAVMSSLGASVNAKRTAAVHVAFNVTGTLIALLFFQPFLNLIDLIVPGTPIQNITIHIAMLHTVFNILAALLFLPFVKQIASITEKVIHESQKEKDAHYKIPIILPKNHVSKDLYTFQVQKEITKMAGRVMDMMGYLNQGLNQQRDMAILIDEINAQEEYVDEMNHEISWFLQKCSRLPTANHSDRNNYSSMISVIQNLEDLSDECCSIMHSLCKFKKNAESESFKNHTEELIEYFNQVYIFYEQTCTYIALGLSEIDKVLLSDVEDRIDSTKRELKKASRKRIENGSNVKAELNYMDLVRKIEKAGDCIFGVIQAIQPNVEDSVLADGSEKNLISAQNVIINTKSRKAFVSGKEVLLAVKEYELLALLMKNKGQVLTRKQLLESVWNYDKEIESRTLDVHIGLLRQKLNNQKLIETVRGVGYRIS